MKFIFGKYTKMKKNVEELIKIFKSTSICGKL